MVAPLLSFVLLQTHHPPKSFRFTAHNSKAGAPVSVPHTPRCPVYFVSHPKTLHITTPHTRFLPQYAHVQRDFPTHPRRRRIFRPGFSPPKPICPPDFSSPTPKFPGGFITTDARFPPPDLKNCDRSQTKSQKLRVRAANKQKRLLLPSMPISPLKTYRNCEIGGNTPQTQQAVAHHKRRNLTKNRLFRYTNLHFTRRHRIFPDNRKPHSRTRNSHASKQPHTSAFIHDNNAIQAQKRDRRAFSTPQCQPKSGKNSKKQTSHPAKKRHTATYTNQRRCAIFTNKQHLPHRLPDKKNGLFSRQNSHSRKTYSIFVKQGRNYRFFV